MIQSKILGEAAGVQYQGVKDESEVNQSGGITTGYLVGYFKRGFMGKPFTVTKDNFQALLGYDPSNPDYLAAEDVFNRSIPSLKVLRIGSFVDGGSGTDNDGSGSGDGDGGSDGGSDEDPNDYIPQPVGTDGDWE